MMKGRCYNKNKDNYRWYGGRGITVCDEWKNDFLQFVKDVGEKPTPKHTLDRINNNGNYEPSNCRWATHSEQMKNSSRSRHDEFTDLDLTHGERDRLRRRRDCICFTCGKKSRPNKTRCLSCSKRETIERQNRVVEKRNHSQLKNRR